MESGGFFFVFFVHLRSKAEQAEEGGIPLSQASLQQLNAVKQQLEQEVRSLAWDLRCGPLSAASRKCFLFEAWYTIRLNHKP